MSFNLCEGKRENAARLTRSRVKRHARYRSFIDRCIPSRDADFRTTARGEKARPAAIGEFPFIARNVAAVWGSNDRDGQLRKPRACTSFDFMARYTHIYARVRACISRVYPPFNLRVNRESLRSSFPSGGKLSPATCKTISAERRRKYTADLTRFTRHIYAHQRYRIRRLCLTRPLVERPLPPREGVTRISGGSESFRRCITDGYSCTFKARASPSSRL